jgi:inorganic pyrophosphatase
MADLYQISNQLDEKALTCRAVIETPQGARQTFTYDYDTGAFALTSLLPEGLVLPLEFGFVPQTKAEDGGPIDIMVLTDDPIPE